MGELIQIRVSAGILYPERALRRWPKLANLAFEPMEDRDDLHQKIIVELLINALHDRMNTDQLPEDLDDSFLQDIEQAFTLKKQLLHYLSEWNPQAADKISYRIEDHLDAMEVNAKKYSDKAKNRY